MKQRPFKFCFLVIVSSLVLASCKKEGSSKKQPLISVVKYNGLIGYKMEYNEKNLWTKWELYKLDPADNSVAGYMTFEYNDKNQMTKTSVYTMPGNIPSRRLFYEYDNAGTQTGYTLYDLLGADPSKPDMKGIFFYNAKKLLTTATIRKNNGDLYRQYSLSYYDNGFLKERDEYDETITHQLRMVGKVIYSVPDVNTVKGWEQLDALPLDGDELTRKPKYETLQRYLYTGGVLTKNTKEIVSAKEYNGDGTLKRHSSTTQFILPASTDEVNIFEYEYVQQ